MIIEPKFQTQIPATMPMQQHQASSLPAFLTTIQRFFYELLTVIVTTGNLSAWRWHLNHAQARQITPLFANQVGKSTPIDPDQEAKLRELKQQIADFSRQRLDTLQKELDQLQKRGSCYGAAVNLLSHELQNQNCSYSCSELLNNVSNSQNRTIFYEEVELLRAKIEEALYQNQDLEDFSRELRGQLQHQKELLPAFTTTGEADKGDYLNFMEISKAIRSLSSQEAFIVHGESDKKSHALAIVQNTRTGRFYFYDRADVISSGRMYAFDSAAELQEAFINYVSSHYSDLADPTSKWRLQKSPIA